jgi:membrane associated rhomboid family serine protease
MESSAAAAPATQTCYRHPGRATAVSCSSCGRPICPECMTPTPVGMRCPECSRQRTQVRTLQSTSTEPRVTVGLIILCAVTFLATSGLSGGSGSLWNELFLDGPDVHLGHDYWRLVTAGFLHAGPLHILFNMYLLWILGQMLEPALGSARFALLYITALLWGSFGALVVEPTTATVGASGAVFGLMGAAAVEMRARGINPLQTGIGALIILNLGLSFVLSNISVGGHIGGLVGGALVGAVYVVAERRGQPALAWAGGLALAAAAVAGALVAAGGTGL